MVVGDAPAATDAHKLRPRARQEPRHAEKLLSVRSSLDKRKPSFLLRDVCHINAGRLHCRRAA